MFGGTGVRITAVAVGRMWNADRDTIVTALNGSDVSRYSMSLDERRGASLRDNPDQGSLTNLEMADFTGDGFADLFTVATYMDRSPLQGDT
jgi:hypothetical protein